MPEPLRDSQPAAAPVGTVTFLFTDFEGSSRLWEAHPEAMRAVMARHDGLLLDAVVEHGGYVVKTTGDGIHASFASACDALDAILAIQRAVRDEPWGEVGAVRVRAGLHTGEAELRAGDYFGPAVNRAARIMATGAGGQTVLSLTTQELVRDALPEGVTLRDLGEHPLKDLHRPERIYQVVAADLPAEFPPLKTLRSHPNNLPVQATPLIGRERELAEARAILLRPEVRLLSLTGPGGTGKTRLGLQLAADALDDFQHGCFFVDLAPIGDPALVLPTIAAALGLQEVGGQPPLTTLTTYLRDRRVLLLLDNFEQVTGAIADIGALLGACPGLRAVVTSRTVLRVYGEQEYPVPPLGLPLRGRRQPLAVLTQYEAVRLFAERARAVRPEFAVSDENAPAIAEICHRLDGLPLAIELAAARTRILAPQALLDRLDHRLRVLTAGAANLPPRQQTLANLIGWSYDLLEAGEQTLFRRLAVFVGGSTLESAEEVGGGPDGEGVLDALASLAEKSLLRREEVDGDFRFRMLETIREFALEHLDASGEAAELRDHHAAHYLALAERAERELYGPNQVAWLDRLDAEIDNVRAALGWLRQRGDAATAFRLAGALWWFCHLRGHFVEGRAWIETLRALPDPSPGRPRAKALAGAGLLAWIQGDFAAARSALEESVGLAEGIDDRRSLGFALIGLALVAVAEGDHLTSHTYFQGSVDLLRELGDDWYLAMALHSMSECAHVSQELASFLGLSDEALRIFRRLGDRWGIASTLHFQGELAYDRGEDAAADALFEQALVLRRELGSKWYIAASLGSLGRLALRQGDDRRATALYRESLLLRQELGEMPGVAYCLEGLARLAAAHGLFERAARIYGTASALRAAIGAPAPPSERAENERVLAPARAALGEEAFATALAAGQAMSSERAGAYAAEDDPPACDAQSAA